MCFSNRLAAVLGALAIAWSACATAVEAADFKVNVHFHINTERHSYNDIVAWLRTNVQTAESLYSNAPALDIRPTFIEENHPRIKVRTNREGRKYSYLGFDNAADLERFMDDNFDNQARTRTEGHLTVLVVDEVVQNEAKGKGLCGRADFPHWVNPFNRKNGIIMATCDAVAYKSDDFVTKYLFAHEIGHFFSLKHTFEPYVNLNPLSVSNCNKDFGNFVKCNSCRGQPLPNDKGELRACDGTSNVMDYCDSKVGREVLNACQLKRAARQRARYQTKDGKTDYQAMAGLRGEGACEADSQCQAGEFCTAGIPNLARNICKPKLARGTLCTTKRQCASGRCSWGVCADADECRADSDCTSSQYCGDPVLGKRTCKAKVANNQACALVGGDKQCASGRCKSGRCYAPNSVAMGGTCYVNEACKQGKCSSVNGTRGSCVCNGDSDCGSGWWCNKGLDLKKNSCQRKLAKGEICGKVGEIGVGHRCKSGKCKAGIGINLKCK